MAQIRVPPHAEGGAVIDTDVHTAKVIVLGPSDPIPAGTPANTVIVRRAS